MGFAAWVVSALVLALEVSRGVAIDLKESASLDTGVDHSNSLSHSDSLSHSNSLSNSNSLNHRHADVQRYRGHRSAQGSVIVEFGAHLSRDGVRGQLRAFLRQYGGRVHHDHALKNAVNVRGISIPFSDIKALLLQQFGSDIVDVHEVSLCMDVIGLVCDWNWNWNWNCCKVAEGERGGRNQVVLFDNQSISFFFFPCHNAKEETQHESQKKKKTSKKRNTPNNRYALLSRIT